MYFVNRRGLAGSKLLFTYASPRDGYIKSRFDPNILSTRLFFHTRSSIAIRVEVCRVEDALKTLHTASSLSCSAKIVLPPDKEGAGDFRGNLRRKHGGTASLQA